MNIQKVSEQIDEKFTELKHQFEEINQRMELVEDAMPGDSRKPDYNGVEKREDEVELEIRAIEDFFRTGSRSELEKRDISITGAGGVPVVPQMSSSIDILLKDLNPIRANATVVSCTRNSYSTAVSLGGCQALRKKERDTRSETDGGTFTQVDINLYELSALPSVTNEVLSDTTFQITAWLTDEVSQAIAAKENDEFINGTGDTDGEAQGILTYPTSADADGTRAFGTLQELTSGTAGSFDGDDLISLVYSLKQAYRANAKWYMSTTAIDAARKLKDANGNPLWADSLAMGQPATLLGFPVVEVAALPDVATDATPIIFGDMQRGYRVVDNTLHRMFIVDTVTKKGWTNFFTATMSGAAVVDSNALKLLKLSA